MAERLVLDASVAVAIVRDEPASAAARRLLAASEVQEVLVPDHFWLEVANVLARRYGHTAAEVAEAVRGLDELGLQTVAIDRPLLLLAVEVMTSHGLSAYDAAYLGLAVVAEADLLTLDVALAAAAGGRDALRRSTPGRRTGEAAGGYDADRSIAALAGFGAYLAQLQSAAEATG